MPYGSGVQSVPGISDPAKLDAWISANTDPPPGRLTGVALISGGRSNLTYRLDFGDQVLVLRRPPLGHLLPTRLDKSRGSPVVAARACTSRPVPTPRARIRHT